MLGDRRDHFEAETDLWTMVNRIAAGRKARELDPALAALRECVAAAGRDTAVESQATRRLVQMLEFVERLTRWYEQMVSLPPQQVTALMKLGSGIVRLLDRRAAKRRESHH